METTERFRAVLFAILRLAFGVAILFYLWKSGVLHFRDFSRLVSAWPLSLAAIALLLLDAFLMALRTSLLFRPQNLHLPIGTATRLTLVSSWFAIFSPGAAGGDVAKIFYATRQAAGRRSEITVVLLLDRAIGLFSLLLIPLLLTPFFLSALRDAQQLRQLIVLTAAIAAIALAGFAFAIYNSPLRKMFLGGNPRPDSKTGRILRALDTLSIYRKRTSTLLLSLCIAIVDNFLVILVAALALRVLNPAALSSKLSLVVPLGTIANSLPLTPGGIGVGEAAFSKVFALAGLSLGAETLVCTRIWRVLAAVPGLLIYLRGVGPVSLHGAPNTSPPKQPDS